MPKKKRSQTNYNLKQSHFKVPTKIIEPEDGLPDMLSCDTERRDKTPKTNRYNQDDNVHSDIEKFKARNGKYTPKETEENKGQPVYIS